MLRTVGDGACAIHSAFGTLTYRGLFKQNARAFLADAWGTTAEDLRRRTNDDALLRDVEDVLWQDLVKPCAAQEAGIEDGNLTVREEDLMVWAKVCKVPDLRQRCVQEVLEQEATYAAFRQERNHVAQVFRQLCVRALEHTFLRPLLSSLGLLEEFCLTAFVLPGSPTVRNKFDALFVHENHTSRLHQSIVEHCGVSNFHVLKERVAHIVGDMHWSSEAQPVFAFCDVLTQAQRFNVGDSQEPFPNFLEKMYSSYLAALRNIISAMWD